MVRFSSADHMRAFVSARRREGLPGSLYIKPSSSPQDRKRNR